MRDQAVNRAALLFTTLCLWAAPALAQLAMPDASQMAGVPLGAPELPDATVTVRVVRERMGNNLPGQAVTLTGGGITKTVTTDGQGRAQFSGFPVGTSVQAQANVSGEILSSQEFPVPAKGGVRVALVAGLAQAAAAEKAAAEAAAREPARQGVVQFGGESRIIFEYQNDTLQGFYLLEIVNGARTPIDVGGPLIVELPPGAAGASTLEGSSTQASVRGELVTITGPFAPGKTIVHVGFSLPAVGASLSLRQKFPAAVEQTFVAAQRIGDMRISSPHLTDIRDMNSNGQTFSIGTGGRLNAGEILSVELTGLPAHSTTPRTIAMSLALLILLGGAWAGTSPGRQRSGADAKLTAQRERMLNDVVQLERQRRRHPLSAQDEARRRRLLAELERVQSSLDHGPSSTDGGMAA